MSQLNATEVKEVNIIISINKLRERSATCSAAGEISSLRKLVPLLWLLVFNEFKQKQMWNSTSGSLSPAAFLLRLSHRPCPESWSTLRKGPRWLWDFPLQICAELMRLEKGNPTAEWGPTHSGSTLVGDVSVGDHVLYPGLTASEQERVMSWPPPRCPGRGVWDLAGVAQAGSHPFSGLRGADKGQGDKRTQRRIQCPGSPGACSGCGPWEITCHLLCQLCLSLPGKQHLVYGTCLIVPTPRMKWILRNVFANIVSIFHTSFSLCFGLEGKKESIYCSWVLAQVL